MGAGVEGGVGEGVGVGVGVGVGAPHWQLVTITTKARRQMTIADIVSFRIIIHLLSTEVYFVHIAYPFSKVVTAK